MTAQTKSHTFNHFDSISINKLLTDLRLNCGTISVHKVAAMGLFQFLMNNTASTVLSARLSFEGAGKKEHPFGK